MKQTIAQTLAGKTCIPDHALIEKTYDPQTGVFTFSDKSTARLLTTFEKCEPYMTASGTTSTNKPVRVWMLA